MEGKAKDRSVPAAASQGTVRDPPPRCSVGASLGPRAMSLHRSPREFLPRSSPPGRRKEMSSWIGPASWFPLVEFCHIGGQVPPLWASPIAQPVKNPPALQEARVRFLGQVDPLEKEMATLSSILA